MVPVQRVLKCGEGWMWGVDSIFLLEIEERYVGMPNWFGYALNICVDMVLM